MTLFYLYTLLVVFIVTVGILASKYLSGDFDKKPTKEPEIPPDCELIDLGGRYMFKIGSHEFVDVRLFNNYYWTWLRPIDVESFCVSRNRNRVLKRGIETYKFYKALGTI
jgi:hypothetical protein